MDTNFQNMVRQKKEDHITPLLDVVAKKIFAKGLYFCLAVIFTLVSYCCCRRNRGTIQSQPTVATVVTYSSAPGVHAIPLPPPRPHQASHILPQPYSTAPSAPDAADVC